MTEHNNSNLSPVTRITLNSSAHSQETNHLITSALTADTNQVLQLTNENGSILTAVSYAENGAMDTLRANPNSIVTIPGLVGVSVLSDNEVILPGSPSDVPECIKSEESNISDSQIPVYNANGTTVSEEFLDQQFFIQGLKQDNEGGSQIVMLTQPSMQHTSSSGQLFLHGNQIIHAAPSVNSQVATGNISTSFSQSEAKLIGVQGYGQARLVIQPTTTNLTSQSLSSSNNRYLIQVGNTIIPHSQSQTINVNEKGHIVIRAASGGSKPESSNRLTPTGKEVLRVVIPEGTTKNINYRTPTSSNSESLSKHVQINCKPGRPSLNKLTFRTNQPVRSDDSVKDNLTAEITRKLYECQNCHSKFMKPQYLKVHMKGCKKPKEDIEPEKSPIYMCSFCKGTFKTKQQIKFHFTKCSHNPYGNKGFGIKRKDIDTKIDGNLVIKKGKLEDIDPVLEQAVQFRCQDCDRTFSKERQYTSHIRKCTKFSVHDLSVARPEYGCEIEEEISLLGEEEDDPFADPSPVQSRKGRIAGRRGRPPGRPNVSASSGVKSLFEGSLPASTTGGLIVADNEGLVRSTTGLAHTVQLTLETASQEGQPNPTALVANSKGVRGRGKPPQAWSLVCSLCQEMFITKVALANHMMTIHGSELLELKSILQGSTEDERTLYKCPLCSHHYDSSELFLEHIVLQHTYKLQETFQNLHNEVQSAGMVIKENFATRLNQLCGVLNALIQKCLSLYLFEASTSATFVCCLCSLVLLTRNLLMEHLSLHHLEELEQLAHKDTHVSVDALSKNNSVLKKVTAEMNVTGSYHGLEDSSKSENNMEEKNECGFCGDEMASKEDMIKHYITDHDVETDEDGCLVDLGIDVDIRVKDTEKLLQLTDGSVEGNLPEKTVLIRKKQRRNWQCKITSLFKHMEEVHNVIVPKERRTFRNLPIFYDWLCSEEKKLDVRYIREFTHIEKNNMKLIHMVCHRFHSSKKEQIENRDSLNKKKWFVRIRRSSNCHARIHLKVQYNETTKDYDGETQMVYYPQHTHENTFEGTKFSSFDKPSDEFSEEIGHISSDGTAMARYMNEFCQTQLSGDNEEKALQGSSSGSTLSYAGVASLTSQADKVPEVEEKYIVGETESRDSENTAKEYVLPADESEWAKLFNALKAQMSEFKSEDKTEAENLLSYENVISVVPLLDQVNVFQRLCALTKYTDIASAY